MFGVGKRLIDCGSHGGAVMPVHTINNLPPIGFEATGRVVGKPAANLTIDGNVVVVVQADQLAEFQRPGQRAALV